MRRVGGALAPKRLGNVGGRFNHIVDRIDRNQWASDSGTGEAGGAKGRTVASTPWQFERLSDLAGNEAGPKVATRASADEPHAADVLGI